VGSVLGSMGFSSNRFLKRRKTMKIATKLTLALVIALVVAAVPLYVYTRPAQLQDGTLQIKGAVTNPLSITFSQLQTYMPTTLQVTLSSSSHASDNGVFNYTGVQLRALLEQVNVSANATSVFIQASDGYGTTIPIQDVMNQNTIIAYQKNGAALSALKNGGEGPLRLIIGSDEFAQRWVRGVAAIEVR
jgi:DMSO/TMAO reductase YedYZ molybdopterin-dependent catalytic subunit